MLSKPLALAVAIVLSAAVSACATQSSANKQGMMNKESAMKCKQAAKSPPGEMKERAPRGRQEGREKEGMKKAGCPMMAAKAGKPENPSARDEQPSEKDPHADHRR